MSEFKALTDAVIKGDIQTAVAETQSAPSDVALCQDHARMHEADQSALSGRSTKR